MTLPLAVLAAPGAAAATRELGTAKPSTTPIVHPPSGPRLSIGVSDHRTMAKVGDQLTYAVSVRNAGTSGVAHLTVTLTLPQGVPPVSASRQGAAAAGKVTWHAVVAAGHAETFRATARVTHPPARMLRLAAVACASATGGSKPTVCAADLDRSAAADAAAVAAGKGPQAAAPAGHPTMGYAAGGVAVLAAGALVVIIGRRSRSRRRMRHSG
jgi:large repetitive protein